jgi:single-strand DNA-binding protein
MSGVNRVILLGRVGKPPEIRSVNNGKKVSNFSIATSESYKDKTTGEKKEVTEWHNIVAWSPIAEIIEKYVSKGDQIYIEGKLQTRSWEKDGVTRYTTEIVAGNLTLLGDRRGSNNEPKPQQNNQTTYASNEGTDDLPF